MIAFTVPLNVLTVSRFVPASPFISTVPSTTFLGTSDGQPLQIQAGNVGINTPGPDRPLTIQGAGANSEWLSLKDTKGGTRWHLNNSNGGLNFAQTFVSDARLFLANNGAVGIGTLAPGARMEIVDAGQMLLQLSGSHGGGTWFNLANSSLGGHSWGFIGTGSANGEGPGKLLLRDHSAGAVRMTWDLNGLVGVGLSSPLHMVHVGATAGALAINTARTKIAVEDASANGRAVLLALAGPGGAIASNRVELQLEASDGEHRAIIGTTSNHELQFRMNNSAVMTFSTQGNVGIGTSSPTDARLDVEGDMHINDHELWLRGGSDHGHGLGWYGAGKPFAGLTLEGPVLYGWSGGALGSTANGQSVALRWDQSGNVAVKVLEVTGGADLAEPFPMSDEDIPKGALVVIDDERPGQLKLSREPYDTRVAGIVSGANGVHPGLTLRQDGLLADGKNVALSGRVYALADASKTPIRPGDLLTSSTSPGRVMKVTDPSRAQGAVVGKAMSALPQGLGLVLVLVTLQ